MIGLGSAEKTRSLSTYVQNLKEPLKSAYDIANTATKFSQSRHKVLYDSKTKGGTLSTRDRLLVKVVAFDGKHKIADRWEDHPYTVISQPNPNIPVYKVRREDGEGRCKTLHRNLLLPIGTRLHCTTSSTSASTKFQSEAERQIHG